MAKLHEVGLSEIPDEEPKEEEKQEINHSDWLRKEIEKRHIDVNKPLEQWSEEERESLADLLNNFYTKVPGGIATYEETKKLGHPLDRFGKIYPQNVAFEKSKPPEWRLSTKRSEESTRQFQENIRLAFINLGIDMEELKKRTEKCVEATHKNWYDNNSRDWINLNSLPVVYSLLDSGYTIYDLSQ